MCCQNCWKKLLPFGLTLMISFFAMNFVKREELIRTEPVKIHYDNSCSKEEGRGTCGASPYVPSFSMCIAHSLTCYKISEKLSGKLFNANVGKKFNSRITPIKVIFKPTPDYTNSARRNQVQGVVRLRVSFLANGNIGSISTIEGLPDGLTEQAISVAGEIKFEPAKRNGIPYTVTKQVQYNFTLY